MERLAQLARERCEAAGARLGKSLALLGESRSRLTLLERYRDEYRGRFASAGSQGITRDGLRNFREFLARLEQAIAQQRAEVAVLERGTEDARALWLAARRREQSFDILFDRAQIESRAIEARQLQKMLDEHSGRAAADASARPSPLR